MKRFPSIVKVVVSLVNINHVPRDLAIVYQILKVLIIVKGLCSDLTSFRVFEGELQGSDINITGGTRRKINERSFKTYIYVDEIFNAFTDNNLVKAVFLFKRDSGQRRITGGGSAGVDSSPRLVSEPQS